MIKPLGVLTKFDDLSEVEQQIVRLAWTGADNSYDHKLCPVSDFPVGSAILAKNDQGQFKQFCGCNVENVWLTASICAERNAATTAAMEGYKQFQIVAHVCRKHPGGSSCGLCRQFLVQFGRSGVLLNILDRDGNVRKALVGDLLPAAQGLPRPYEDLTEEEKTQVDSLAELKSLSHVPYSKKPRAALFVAANNRGETGTFKGVSDENAAYGASVVAESVAMRSARSAGFNKSLRLFATVDDLTAVNQIEGGCLQVLREFGPDCPIMLVDNNKTGILTSLDELLPEAFGPEAL